MNIEEIPSVYVSETQHRTGPEPLPRSSLSQQQLSSRRSRQNNRNEERRMSAPRRGWAETPPPDPPNPGAKLATRSTLEGYSTPNSGADSPFEAANSDGALSPEDASSISSSKSSRRADMSDQIRQRIRQNAKSLVERKRGSVQLAKRLLRSQTLQSGNGGTPEPPKDYSVIDKQIQKAIELGSKYVAKEQTLVPSDTVQQSFFYGMETFLNNIFIDEDVLLPPNNTENSFINKSLPTMAHFLDSQNLIEYKKAKSLTKIKSDKFSAFLTIYRNRALIDNETQYSTLKDPYLDLESQLFSAKPLRNYSILAQRIGSEFFEKNAQIGTITNRPKKMELDGENEEISSFGLLTYRKAENWLEDDYEDSEFNEQSAMEFSRRRHARHFARLKMDVNRLEFNHHWLFSEEDRFARELQLFYNDYLNTMEKVMKQVRRYLEYKQNYEMGQFSENELAGKNISEIHHELVTNCEELKKIEELLNNSWNSLENLRKTQKFSTTNLILLKDESETDNLFDSDQLEIPEELQKLLKYSSYTLKEHKNTNKDIPKIELERLEAIKKCRIQIQIYYNSLLVSVTETKPFKYNTFCVDFKQIYDLQVFEPPEQLKLVIRERFGRGAWQNLAHVFVPLPEESSDEIGPQESFRDRFKEETNNFEETNENDPIENCGMEFASDIIRGSHKNSLGCGIPRVSSFIHGKLFYWAKWLRKPLSNGFTDTTFKIKNKLSLNGANNYPELIPNASRLISDEDFQLVLQNTISGTESFKGALLAGTNRSAVSPLDEAVNMSTELSLDAFRRIGHAYAVLTRKHLMENFALGQRRKNYFEIVHEVPLPTMFRTFGTIFGSHDISRKLKPMRCVTGDRNRKETKSHRIIVNIQSASNLPERVSGDPTRIFVEAIFQQKTAQSGIVEGRHANWQETLSLEMDSTDPLDFKNIIEQLQLNVFDQIVSALEHDDREPNTLHEQYELRWLGAVHIPFSTIYTLGKIDGTLTLKLPLFCTGYRMLEKPSTIKVLITVDPPPTIPLKLFEADETFPIGETDPKIVSKCQKWQTFLRTNFPGRRFLALANSSEGKRILATRFLRPIQPPPKILEKSAQNRESAVGMALQLVSAIPFIADPVMFPGECDLWTTVEEMLKMGCGDAEEHAILFVCWLLAMQLAAVLVLGTSLPEGVKAAYVLVQFDEHTSWLINPSNGMRYLPNNPICPLISVGTIITPTNIYGNIQKCTHPSLLDFDLRKKSHWEPLFGENPPNELVSVQSATIPYESVNEDLLVELRASLEREIKLRFDSARAYGIPQWNLLAARCLRDILNDSWSDVEEDTDNFHNPNFSSQVQLLEVERRLGELRHSYRIHAIAFRRGYVNRRELIEDVLTTHMHVNSEQTAQFALAVHVQPFINQIISVSVALATLIPLT